MFTLKFPQRTESGQEKTVPADALA